MRYDWRVLTAAVIVAIAAGWFLTRSVQRPTADELEMERDLSELSEALREDQNTDFEIARTESTSMQRFPTSLQYRRAVDFWRPVFDQRGKE